MLQWFSLIPRLSQPQLLILQGMRAGRLGMRLLGLPVLYPLHEFLQHHHKYTHICALKKTDCFRYCVLYKDCGNKRLATSPNMYDISIVVSVMC